MEREEKKERRRGEEKQMRSVAVSKAGWPMHGAAPLHPPDAGQGVEAESRRDTEGVSRALRGSATRRPLPQCSVRRQSSVHSSPVSLTAYEI